jgi:catechol 2,3-dioxygenase
LVSNYHQHPLNFIKSITLLVENKQKMIDFYTWLGFSVLSTSASKTILGTTVPLLTLKHDCVYPRETKPTQGLYHVAYLLPNREALGTILKHLIQSKYPLQGLSDHGVSEAIYLADPEGNGIEIYVDRPRLLWPYVGNQLAMITERMKYQEVLALAKPFTGLPKETIVGHLHLHVSDLTLATKHYQSKLGYQLMQHYVDSAAFLSTGGYHHHLGINIWQGQDIPIKNLKTTGIEGYTIHGKGTPWVDLAGLNVSYQN